MSQRPRVQRQQWEGIYTVEFTLDEFAWRCQSVGEALVANGWSCLLAYDTRFLSNQFAHYAYALLQSQGVQVSLCSMPVSFPAIGLALDQRRADCALVVSAGNLPHWHNGLILLAPQLASAPLVTKPVATLATTGAVSFPPPPLTPTEQTQLDLRTPYFEWLRTNVDMELIRRSALTVFVDTMNGSTISYIPHVIGEGTQTKAIEINREPDPLFGRQPPQPTEANLNRLRKLVKESESHIGVALSADGCAITVTDSAGELITPPELTLLLATYLARQHRQKGVVVVPFVGEESAHLRNLEQATGLKIEAVSNPAARIAEIVAQDRNNLLAGTTANGEITLGRYKGVPDATLVALLLLEIVARAGGKLRAQVDDMKSRMNGA